MILVLKMYYYVWSGDMFLFQAIYHIFYIISAATQDLDTAIHLSGGKGKSACLAYCQRAIVRRLQGNQQLATEDYKKAAELGSDFARSQLVQMNPYAALCNQMLRKVMTQYQ